MGAQNSPSHKNNVIYKFLSDIFNINNNKKKKILTLAILSQHTLVG